MAHGKHIFGFSIDMGTENESAIPFEKSVYVKELLQHYEELYREFA